MSKGYDRNESLATKKDEVFREDYIPDNILFRDKQMTKAMRLLQQGFNVFMSGDISTGKTLVLLQLYRLFRMKDNSKYACVYHYCRNTNLSDIYHSIAKEINYPLQRNVRLKQHQTLMKEFMKEKGIERVFLCLDEVDLLLKLFLADDELLCDFVDDSMYTVILISNHPDFLDAFGSRAIDRLCIDEKHNTIRFRNYHSYEIVEILKQRVKLGILNGTISDIEIHAIERIIQESRNTVREGIKMIAKIYDHKVFNGITDPLSEGKIKKFVSLVRKNSKIQAFKKMDSNIKTALIIVTEIFTAQKHKKFVTIEDVMKSWNAKTAESRIITSREYSSIRIYLERLVTSKYLKRTNQKRPGKRGYVVGYIPIYDYDQFDLYLERKQVRTKSLLEIEEDAERFNNVLKNLDQETSEPY